MIAAPDALNHLVAHLFESSAGSNVNFLLSLAGWAFQRHHNIPLVSHRWASYRKFYRRRTPARTSPERLRKCFHRRLLLRRFPEPVRVEGAVRSCVPRSSWAANFGG